MTSTSPPPPPPTTTQPIYYGPAEFETPKALMNNFINVPASCISNFSNEDFDLANDLLRLQGKLQKIISPYELYTPEHRRQMYELTIAMEDIDYVYDIQRIGFVDRIYYKLFARSYNLGQYLYFCIFISSKHCDCARCKVGVVMMTFNPDVYVNSLAAGHHTSLYIRNEMMIQGYDIVERPWTSNSLKAKAFGAMCKYINFSRPDDANIYQQTIAAVMDPVNGPMISRAIVDIIKRDTEVHKEIMILSEDYFSQATYKVWNFNTLWIYPCYQIMEDDNQHADVLSCWSGSIYGVALKIPNEVWNFVLRKVQLGNEERLKRLRLYKKTYTFDSGYHNVEDFIEKVTAQIREEEAYLRNVNSKLLWCKYLTIFNNFGLCCVYCKKHYKNYRGLFVHLRNAHAITIEHAFKDDDLLKVYMAAFKRVNVKSKCEYTEQDMLKLLKASQKKDDDLTPEESTTKLPLDSQESTTESLDSQESVVSLESQDSGVDSNTQNMENDDGVYDFKEESTSDQISVYGSTKRKPADKSSDEGSTTTTTTTVQEECQAPPSPSVSSSSSSSSDSSVSSDSSEDEEVSEVTDSPANEKEVVSDNMTEADNSMSELLDVNILETSFAQQIIDNTVKSPAVQEELLLNNFDPKVFSTADNSNLTYREIDSTLLIEANSSANMTELETSKEKVVLNKPPKAKAARYKKNEPKKSEVRKHTSKENLRTNKNDHSVSQEEKNITQEKNISGKKRKLKEPQNSNPKTKKRKTSISESDDETVKRSEDKIECETRRSGQTKNTENTNQKKKVLKSDSARFESHDSNQEVHKHNTNRPAKRTATTERQKKKQAKPTKGDLGKGVSDGELETSVSVPNDNGRPVQKQRAEKVKTRNNNRHGLAPKSTKSKVTAEERDTYMCLHMRNSLEAESTKERNFTNDAHKAMYDDLISSIQDSVSSNTVRRNLKTRNNSLYKKYASEYGKAKTRSDNRDNLADVVFARIHSDHFGKKTGKTSNPYKAEVMVNQLNNFKTYINELKISDTKLKMEEYLKEKYNDHANIVNWKENLKSFSKLSTLAEYKTQVNTLKRSCGTIPTVKSIVKLFANALTSDVFKVMEKEGSTLVYEVKGRNGSKEVKPLKNLISQLIKGSSVSNLKYVLSDSGSQYIRWFDGYNKIKTSLNVSNNMKWFLNHVVHTIKDSSNPMNPLSKISMQEIKRYVKAFSDYIVVNVSKSENEVEIKPIFTEGFFHNLTIFSMKFLYKLYDKILLFYKTNAFRSQIPNEFHMGMVSLYMKNDLYEDRFNPPSEMKSSYDTFMNKSGKSKVNLNGFMSTERIANCLFHQRLISRGFNLKSLDDLLPYFRKEDWRIVDLIESKCNMTVYDNLRSCLFVFLYNMVCNILIDRKFVNGENVVTSKLITWDFFKTIMFDLKYYEYGSIVSSVLHSFPTLHLKDEGVKGDSKEPGIVDYRDSPWFVVCGDHKKELFSELFSSICEQSDDEVEVDKVYEKMECDSAPAKESSSTAVDNAKDKEELMQVDNNDIVRQSGKVNAEAAEEEEDDDDDEDEDDDDDEDEEEDDDDEDEPRFISDSESDCE